MKRCLYILVLLMLPLLTSCGHYHPYWDDHTDGHHGKLAVTERVWIDVTWDADSYEPWLGRYEDADLDLELEAPGYELITPVQDSYDCYHWGNDYGHRGSGNESIECLFPASGTYEIRLINASDYFEHARNEVIIEEDDGYSFYEDSWTESKTIAPWDIKILPLHIN